MLLKTAVFLSCVWIVSQCPVSLESVSPLWPEPILEVIDLSVLSYAGPSHRAAGDSSHVAFLHSLEHMTILLPVRH